MFPKQGGGAPPVTPFVYMQPSFTSDPTSIFGGVFRALARGQNGTTRGTATGPSTGNLAAASEPIPVNGQFGTWPLTGKNALALEFANNFSANLTSGRIGVNLSIVSILFSGGAPVSGFVVSVIFEALVTGTSVTFEISELVSGRSGVIGPYPVAGNSLADSCIYFDGVNVGVIFNGADAGYFTDGGGAIPITPAPVGFTINEEANNEAVAPGDESGTLAAAFVFQGPLLSAQPLPGTGWLDLAGNPL